MCGRFAFDVDLETLKGRFSAGAEFQSLQPHFNVAPGMMMPIIVRNSPNKAILARWGLIPSWSKDPNIAYRTVNARAEGIADKPAFRGSFKHTRCLVPATGFFEWKHVNKEKIPYYIRLKDRDLFAFAGLYDTWHDAQDHPLTTFTIITTTPNSLMEPIHNRMPVVFSEKDEDTWLNPEETDRERLLKLLDPYPASGMEAYPVSTLVNSPANDTPDILKQASSQESLL